MKRYTLICSCTLIAAVLSGCITPTRAMQALVGKPSTEVIAQCGPPQQRMPDGRGGEIWCYFEERQWTTPGQVTTTAYGTGNTYGNINANVYGATYRGNSTAYAKATTTYTPPQTEGYTASRTFFIDRNGIVYRWAWRGL